MYLKLKFNAPEMGIDLDFEMEIDEDEICAALDTLGKIGMNILNDETNTEVTATETINNIINNIKDVLDEFEEDDTDDTNDDNSWNTNMDNSEEGARGGVDNIWRVV